MSVTLTEQSVRDQTKTVTRRLGWLFLKPGDTLTLCRKVMGRKRQDGTVEPLERIAEVEVLSVQRELLCAITPDEVRREGMPSYYFPGLFVTFFCTHMKCTPDTEVTRIEWRYL
jgi:hypothetical protein